ncbi:MAG: hypothetical protein VB140_06355 [Burkholderia sp.]
MQTSLVRNAFVSPAIMPVDAIASSRSIDATTPVRLHDGRVEQHVFDLRFFRHRVRHAFP